MNLLKPFETEINFDSPNRESINQSIYDETDVILGRGAYGIVVRGNYRKCKVAVKILEKSNCTKYNSLLLEANILNLSHNNIIRILKIVDCKTYGAIIMERFNGHCLQQCLDRCEIDLVHRLYILSDIASALEFCNENKIVHFDLKPQNVFVAVHPMVKGRAYTCKLFDFGCSLKLDHHLLYDGSYENVGGTVRYAAPEILLNHQPDCSADIYSLAIVMWQMKENKIPYWQIQENEIILWNVVKRDMRPDSLEIINMLKDKPNVLKTSRINSKSESSFLQLKKFIKSPLTPKSYQKIPTILINKSLKMAEKPIYGSHQKAYISKNKQKLLIGRKLFDAKLSSSLENEDYDGDKNSNVNMESLFIDKNLYLCSPEKILFAESEYDRAYRNCWDREVKHRYNAVKIQSIFKELLNSLRFYFPENGSNKDLNW